MAAEYSHLEEESRHNENPKKNANIFSILSFWWVGELFAIGNKRPLENDDLFPLLDEDKTQTSTEKLQRTWNEEAGRASSKGRNGHRLLKALIRMFPCTDHMFLLSIVLLPAVCNVLQQVFLSLLLPELMKFSVEKFSLAYVYGAGICLSSLVRFISVHQFCFHSHLVALRWKSATVGIVYKKVRATFIP